MNIHKINRFMLLLTLFISLGFLGTIVAGNTLSTSESATGFVSAKVISNIDLSDGQTEDFWTNITVFQNVSEYGSGGYVKFANNGSHLFSLFVSARDNKWISIEFEPNPDACMTNLNDGWTIYINQAENVTTAKDIKFVGTVRPEDDIQKDISVESIFSGEFVYTEIMRPFETNDTEGYDISFSNGSLNMVQFASDKEHFGARRDYYLFLIDQVVAGAMGTVDPGDIIVPTDIPSAFNVNQLKYIMLGVTPIGVFAFMIIHTARRVYASPIENENTRVVNKSFKPPTFIERFRETFLE